MGSKYPLKRLLTFCSEHVVRALFTPAVTFYLLIERLWIPHRIQ